MSVKVPVTVELKDESQLGRIVEMVDGDAPPANKVDAFVNEMVRQVIDGGMILPPSVVDRLLEISPDMEDSDRLVEAVEMGTGMNGGDMIIRWPIDPALTQPLKDRAETNGVSVQQLIRDTMDQFVALGYFYDVGVDMKTVFLSREDEKIAAEILGNKDFTSADIMDALRKIALPAPYPDEDQGDGKKDPNEDDIFVDDAETIPAS